MTTSIFRCDRFLPSSIWKFLSYTRRITWRRQQVPAVCLQPVLLPSFSQLTLNDPLSLSRLSTFASSFLLQIQSPPSVSVSPGYLFFWVFFRYWVLFLLLFLFFNCFNFSIPGPKSYIQKLFHQSMSTKYWRFLA